MNNSINEVSFSDRYKRYCRELDKEDNLINDRVKWLLGSQSILFAAIGVTGVGPGSIIVRIVPWVGFTLSIIIWISVFAAVRSHMNYQKSLKEPCGGDCEDFDPDKAYPQLHRNERTILLGFFAPIVLPVIFIVAWGLLIAALNCP